MSQNVRRIDFAAGRARVSKRQEYTAAAVDIREALYSAERSVEAGLLNMGRLQARVIERRREVGLAATVGHDLVREAFHASGKMMEALDAAVRFHVAAQAQCDRLGVRMDFGSHDKHADERIFDGG